MWDFLLSKKVEVVQAIFPKVQEFVEEFHAGKAAGHNENAAANKTVVKDHTGAQAALKPEAKKAPASSASTTGGVKRGSNRIEIKETFYCCKLPHAYHHS